MASVAAAAALCTFGLLPAAPAQAASIMANPADCSTTRISNSTTSMTCTNRPAGQQWRLWVTCMSGWVDTDAYGNVVTGNGTSTATCPYSSWAFYPTFVLV